MMQTDSVKLKLEQEIQFSEPKVKFKYIDTIRGVAILMVILVHTAQKVSGLHSFTKFFTGYGALGVQLFFVASAYTLCISAETRKNESQPLVKYAIRRFFRIAPLYYLGIIGFFFLALTTAYFSNGRISIPEHYTLLNIISNVLFVHGFYPPANNNIVPGGWSIGTEMAFYVVFPMLFALASKYWGSIRNVILGVLIGFLFSQITLLVLASNGISVSNDFVYCNLINQIPVFILGIAYYFWSTLKNQRFNWKIDALAFVVLSGVSLYFRKLSVEIPYLLSCIPFISGLSFLFLMELFRKLDILNSNILVRIGKVSYSMYIIHFIFAWLMTSLIAPLFNKILISEVTLLLLYPTVVASTFYLATLSEKHIEKPFIDLGRSIIKNKLN
jgi:peptidoglycan/LPS O-acetylase OafA/YrhL